MNSSRGRGKGGNGAVWKWTELSHSNFALVGMCLSDWIWSEISHAWCRITKQHLQSLYQVGTRSPSAPQVVMTPNTSGHYPSTLFSPETSFPLPLATTALSPFREEDNTGTHSFSAILMHPRKKTINRQYTPYYSECLEIIFFPLARPVLNLHFTILSKSGSNPHKYSSLKPHIQIPGFRNFGRIVQSRHWEGVMIEKIMVWTTWSQQESSGSQS